LSGTYIYTIDKLCQLALTDNVATSPNFPNGSTIVYLSTLVQSGAGSNEIELSAGRVAFTQGSGTPGQGSFSTNGMTADGSAILLKTTGENTGTIGAPLTISGSAGTGSFSQTATTLSLPGNSTTPVKFTVYYGQSVSGIASYAVAFGNNGEGCAQRFVFTRV
jgi:archaellin